MEMSQSQPKSHFDSIEEADEIEDEELEEYIKEYKNKGKLPQSRTRTRTEFPKKKGRSREEIKRKTEKSNDFKDLLSTTLPAKLPYRAPTFFFSENLQPHAN